MRHSAQSPLQPCMVPDSRQLSAYQTIGLVTDLAINHSQHSNLSVKEVLSRLTVAMRTGRSKVFFDHESRPLGYASWVTLTDEEHRRQLEQPLYTPTSFNALSLKDSGKNLWFRDLLCPFSSPLALLRLLKQELRDHERAYILPDWDGGSVQTRRAW